MTEDQYIAKVPVIATWSPEARAQFVEGMNELNGMALLGPPDDVTDAVGVLVLGALGPVARYVPRAHVLAEAEAEQGFPPEALASLLKPSPGTLQVLIIGGVKMRMLLEIPGKMIRVSQVGSEGN